MAISLNSFASYASLRLPSAATLLHAACSPDKDLVLLVSLQEHKLLLGLWKIQGLRRWEVAVGNSRGTSRDIIAAVWSPDGQIVGIAHDPPCVTLHSIHDGSEIRNLSIRHSVEDLTVLTPKITNIWWFKEEKSEPGTSMPEIMKRGPGLPGSALSILNMMPMLDPVDDEPSMIAINMLGNPSSKLPHAAADTNVQPPELLDWPSLPTDPLTASIKPSKPAGTSDEPQPGEELDAIDDTNLNSLLMVVDNCGHLFPFLDGTYPLGLSSIGPSRHLLSMYKEPRSSLVHLYAESPPPDDTRVGPRVSVTNLFPFTLRFPLLETRHARDVAEVSSSARELIWYIKRLHRELWKDWHSEGREKRGVRKIADEWISQLVKRMQDVTDDDITVDHALADLLQLLATGRSTDSLTDFMATHESMSERSFLKWETTVKEVYLKIRDYAEKRIAPAAQRLHLLLEQVLGWARLGHQFAAFEFDPDEVLRCLDLIKKLIFESGSMAAKARSELSRFREFLTWLKWESARANKADGSEATPPLRFDVLEVHRYITTSARGLHPLDDHFNKYKRSMGDLNGYRFPPPTRLSTALQRAQAAIRDPSQTRWNETGYRHTSRSEDIYLSSVLSELPKRCSRMFAHASEAVSRTAIYDSLDALHRPLPPLTVIPTMTREKWEPRSIENRGSQEMWHYFAMRVPVAEAEPQWMCFARTKSVVPKAICEVEVAMAALSFPDGRTEPSFEVLQMEFFDQDNFLVVCRLFDGVDTGPTVISLFNYSEFNYQASNPYVIGMTREELGLVALERAKSGELPISPVTLKRARELPGCREGSVSLAVNGQPGRKFVVVLDETGTWVEMLDLGDDDAGEEDGDEEMTDGTGGG